MKRVGLMGIICCVGCLYAQQLPDKVTFDVAKVRLTQQDIVSILSEYELRHQELPMKDGAAYGLTDHNRRIIYISPNQDSGEMADTIIHELFHVKFQRARLQVPEEAVDALTKATMAEWYTKPFIEQVKP